MQINRIYSIKQGAVFNNYISTGSEDELRQLNLIYGFNGTGKTTISRILASLESGTPCANLPEDCSFEIRLSNGSNIKNNSNLDLLKGKIFVFNVDYVSANIRWNEASANPIYYIGQEQAELAKEFKELQIQISTAETIMHHSVSDQDKAEKSYNSSLTNVAREISEQLNLGRKYDRNKLIQDYGTYQFHQSDLLEALKLDELKAIIALPAPLPRLAKIMLPPINLQHEIENIRKLTAKSLGTITLEALRKNPTMLQWIKHGFDYHRKANLVECLFCGAKLEQDRISDLEQILNQSFSGLLAELKHAQANLEGLMQNLTHITLTLPSKNDVAGDLSREYTSVADQLKTTCEHSLASLGVIKQKIILKLENPSEVIDLQSPQFATALSVAFADFNSLIDKHNSYHDDFSKVRESSRQIVKNHYLARHHSSIQSLDIENKKAAERKKEQSAELEQLRSKLKEVKAKLAHHGPAAEVLNKTIGNYLGHREIEILPTDNGYRIQRNGAIVRGTLSEGERTAIAFCFFMANLIAEGRKLNDLIIVVDDPISSLDTQALNYVFTLITSQLSKTAQLIILTHNLNFMNSIKKWLKKRAEGKEVAPTASLLFIESTFDTQTKKRTSKIIKLPTFIREYESEYHYFFDKLFNFVQNPIETCDFLHMVPNCLRKVMEIFLAFKCPDSSPLKDKINQTLERTTHGLDTVQVQAIERLVQLESHSDNLDDLVTFSSLTVEETLGGAKAFFEFMKSIDPIHYDRMRKLCKGN